MTNKKNTLLILFSVRFFSSFAFAILFSSLSLYVVDNLHYQPASASNLVGAFIAFNYFLPVIGGYVGDRLLSFKQLFVLGHFARGVGCCFLVYAAIHSPNLGLACFLIGSLASSVSINMFITQMYSAEDIVGRKIAFYWNYAGMNLGFLIGYLLAGMFGLKADYNHLFIYAAVVSFVSALIAQLFLKERADESTRSWFAKHWSHAVGLLLVVVLVAIMAWVLRYADILHILLLSMSVVALLSVFVLVLLPRYREHKAKLSVFYLFMLISVLFWSVYMTVPTAFLLFFQKNMSETFDGIKIATQWLEIFDSITIIIGSFLLTRAMLFIKRRCKFFAYSSSMFAIGLLCVTGGLFLMAHGIAATTPHQKISLVWIILFIVSLSLGELFIGPTGYSLIGELVPDSLKGLFMGAWIMTLGISSSIASSFSDKVIVPMIDNFSVNRVSFINTFDSMALVFVVIAIALFLFFPIFKRILESRVEQYKSEV
ncbi:MAG: MFS transporter [Gammaproteobacteria bacterium]|nr:MFS transporter [Gammaproteobacteria bacterium]